MTLKAAHLFVDVDGRKHVLGIWIDDTELAKFWNQVLTQLRNRGLKDILILCCDGLTGLTDAARSVFPDTVIQTCVVHVIRNAMKFVSFGDRKKVAAAMRAIYTAPTVEAAELALNEFRKEFGKQYPGSIAVWERAWPEFIPFLDYPSELRKVVYTTNLIESINYQLRKITKTRGHFPATKQRSNCCTWESAISAPNEEVTPAPAPGLETSPELPRPPLPRTTPPQLTNR